MSTLFTRRWLTSLGVALLFGTACFFLGRWQWSKYQDRLSEARIVEANYDQAPIPLGQALPLTSTPLAPQAEWTTVTASGEYLTDQTYFVRNRVLDQASGFEVLVPLRTAAGTLIVDRGWVPITGAADVVPPTPTTPPGPVRVSGWLRPSEPDLGRDLTGRQLASITLAELTRRTGLDLYGGYLRLDQETGAGGQTVERPRQLPRPDADLGPHQAYAIQWWLAMPAGLIFVLVGVRNERRAMAEDLEWEMAAMAEPVPAGTAASEGEGEADGPAPASAVPAERVRARRPKKTRIWDEEDW